MSKASAVRRGLLLSRVDEGCGRKNGLGLQTRPPSNSCARLTVPLWYLSSLCRTVDARTRSAFRPRRRHFRSLRRKIKELEVMVADVIPETDDTTTIVLFTGNDILNYRPGPHDRPAPVRGPRPLGAVPRRPQGQEGAAARLLACLLAERKIPCDHHQGGVRQRAEPKYPPRTRPSSPPSSSSARSGGRAWR